MGGIHEDAARMALLLGSSRMDYFWKCGKVANKRWADPAGKRGLPG